MSSRPASHMSNGGIDWVASSRISGGERVDVVVLERGDVAFEQLPVDVRRAARPAARSRCSSVARARCSALLTEATRRVEQLGDLARLPAQHLAEDQRCALPRRQVLQGGDERQADRVALDATSVRRRESGIGWSQVDLGRHVQVLDRAAPPPGRGPSAARAAPARSACRGRRSSRCGRATSAAPRGPRSGRCARQARIIVSCTASSASNGEASMR